LYIAGYQAFLPVRQRFFLCPDHKFDGEFRKTGIKSQKKSTGIQLKTTVHKNPSLSQSKSEGFLCHCMAKNAKLRPHVKKE